MAGVTMRGAAGAGGAGAGGLTAGGAVAAGFVACACAGGAAGFGGAAGAGGAAGCFLSRMAFSTSPGLEMCDRSILVLISSGPACGAREVLPAPPCPSPEPLKCARTFSASWSSSELECVFFSVTPTSVNTSRMALLLTSSSLARSLIRILLIRLFVPPNFVPLSLHINLTESC